MFFHSSVTDTFRVNKFADEMVGTTQDALERGNGKRRDINDRLDFS
jgi:hypothetical protein